jgi:WD40 repeat protein/serine/threonine protein kinase
MVTRFTCTRGHEWESLEATASDTELACPVCSRLFDTPPSPCPRNPAAADDPWVTSATASSSATLEVPSLVPGYEMLGEIGRGGMGVVYRARQIKLDRVVALKMILAGGHSGAEVRARFETEAHAAARLQHPGIVQIYEFGEADGLPFLSLEYIDGGSLQHALGGKPLPPRQAAVLAEKMARAVHFAHERGVVHRDLKPANVLLPAAACGFALTGSDAANAKPQTDVVPKITDFGLAKLLDSDSRQTHSGAVLGTPCYMAPEQALGHGAQVGPWTDIYALGAVLYEMLTGRPPFLRVTMMETLGQVVAHDPIPPRRLQALVPRDLETICLKCLHKEPKKRYSTAKELAEDLERFLGDRPIHARPTSVAEKVLRWMHRQPLNASLLGLVVLMGLAGILVAWLNARGPQPPSQQEAEQQLYFNRIALADRELRNGKPAWARRQLDLCPAPYRLWEYHYLDRALRGKPTTTWPAHPRAITCLAFAPKAALLATASGDGTVRLWQLPTGQLVRELPGHPNGVNWACFSPDGRYLASAGDDQTVTLWHTDTGRPWKRLVGHGQPVAAVAFHPEGRLLASCTFDSDEPGQVWLWDVERGMVLHRYCGHTSRVGGLAYSPDGRWLASASHDGTVRLLDGRTAQEVLVVREHAFPVSAIVFSPDGRLVASAAGRLETDRPDQEEVLIWHAATGKVVHRLQGHQRRPTTLAFSADGQRLATAGWDREIKLWDVGTGQEVLTLQGHTDSVLHLAFSPGGRWLASGGLDHQVRLHDGGLLSR